MRKNREFHRAYTRIMDDNGISDYEFVFRSKHSALVFQLGGRSHTIFFPNTASDHHAVQNGVSYVKRYLRQFLLSETEPPQPVVTNERRKQLQ